MVTDVLNQDAFIAIFAILLLPAVVLNLLLLAFLFRPFLFRLLPRFRRLLPPLSLSPKSESLDPVVESTSAKGVVLVAVGVSNLLAAFLHHALVLHVYSAMDGVQPPPVSCSTAITSELSAYVFPALTRLLLAVVLMTEAHLLTSSSDDIRSMTTACALAAAAVVYAFGVLGPVFFFLYLDMATEPCYPGWTVLRYTSNPSDGRVLPVLSYVVPVVAILAGLTTLAITYLRSRKSAEESSKGSRGLDGSSGALPSASVSSPADSFNSNMSLRGTSNSQAWSKGGNSGTSPNDAWPDHRNSHSPKEPWPNNGKSCRSYNDTRNSPVERRDEEPPTHFLDAEIYNNRNNTEVFVTRPATFPYDTILAAVLAVSMELLFCVRQFAYWDLQSDGRDSHRLMSVEQWIRLWAADRFLSLLALSFIPSCWLFGPYVRSCLQRQAKVSPPPQRPPPPRPYTEEKDWTGHSVKPDEMDDDGRDKRELQGDAESYDDRNAETQIDGRRNLEMNRVKEWSQDGRGWSHDERGWSHDNRRWSPEERPQNQNEGGWNQRERGRSEDDRGWNQGDHRHALAASHQNRDRNRGEVKTTSENPRVRSGQRLLLPPRQQSGESRRQNSSTSAHWEDEAGDNTPTAGQTRGRLDPNSASSGQDTARPPVFRGNGRVGTAALGRGTNVGSSDRFTAAKETVASTSLPDCKRNGWSVSGTSFSQPTARTQRPRDYTVERNEAVDGGRFGVNAPGGGVEGSSAAHKEWGRDRALLPAGRGRGTSLNAERAGQDARNGQYFTRGPDARNGQVLARGQDFRSRQDFVREQEFGRGQDLRTQHDVTREQNTFGGQRVRGKPVVPPRPNQRESWEEHSPLEHEMVGQRPHGAQRSPRSMALRNNGTGYQASRQQASGHEKLINGRLLAEEHTRYGEEEEGRSRRRLDFFETRQLSPDYDSTHARNDRQKRKQHVQFGMLGHEGETGESYLESMC